LESEESEAQESEAQESEAQESISDTTNTTESTIQRDFASIKAGLENKLNANISFASSDVSEYPNVKVYFRMENESGEISDDRLNESVFRILTLKFLYSK